MGCGLYGQWPRANDDMQLQPAADRKLASRANHEDPGRPAVTCTARLAKRPIDNYILASDLPPSL